MAEFCLDCWNEMNHTRLTQEDVILTDYSDFAKNVKK